MDSGVLVEVLVEAALETLEEGLNRRLTDEVQRRSGLFLGGLLFVKSV